MTPQEHLQNSAQKWFNETGLSRIRIVSGLVLFVYVLIHYLNHAFGLISLELMEQVGDVVQSFWRFLPLTVILYGALLAHLICSLLKVYYRGTLRMTFSEWMQLLFGLAIPFLMVTHFMGTRFAAQNYGINDSYTYVLLSTFVFSKVSGWINAAGLIVAWVHGCMGLYMWVRLKSWYRSIHGKLGLVLAALIPAFALAGYLSAAREIAPFATDGEFMGQYYENLNIPNEAFWDSLATNTDFARRLVLAIIIGFILARIIKVMLLRRAPMITIDYLDGPTIRQPIGGTLLDMSKAAGVPHASICGGRGRCSTCRVRVLSPSSDLAAASDAERMVLRNLHTESNIRLACQLHPENNLKVMRLLPWDTSLQAARTITPAATGREQIITVLFIDIRDFTRTSEARLPFDVVYLINQFSQSMGREVGAHGGHVDKFLGDGFMALFGLTTSAHDGARNAFDAAGTMMTALEQLNRQLESELDQPLRIGIGVHTGPAIIGEMGYGSSRGLTAIGDTVNSASRLEAATKEENCVLCVSAKTLSTAKLKAPENALRHIHVRGKKDKMSIYALNETSGLSKLPNDVNTEGIKI